VFTGPDFGSPVRFSVLCEHLPIEVVPDCAETHGRAYVPYLLRFEYELQWLSDNVGRVDRVFHKDSFDVYFQGDPFASHISSRFLKFIVEPHQIRSCGWNLAWVLKCYGGEMLNRMSHKFIICSGSIAGGAGPYTRLLELMTNQTHWVTYWQPSMDQPMFNYLVWNGHVQKANIPYILTGCDKGFFSVQWCVVERNVICNEQAVIAVMNTVPSSIHQYNRLQKPSDHLYDRCGMPRQKSTGN
jgi:hypothetical protein